MIMVQNLLFPLGNADQISRIQWRKKRKWNVKDVIARWSSNDSEIFTMIPGLSILMDGAV